MQVDWQTFKNFISTRNLSIQYISFNGNYYMKGFDSFFTLECSLPLDRTSCDDTVDFEDNFKANGNKSPTQSIIVQSQPTSVISSMPDPTPFAQPTYRTKRDAIPSLISVDPGNVGDIDYKLPTELYVSGGDIVIENAELGDYLVAYVEDMDGMIPSPYRTTLCEAWPVVAKYINKTFIMVTQPGTILAGAMTTHTIDTYPLNAKITTGLYLCIEYHAVNSGLTRRIAVNYHLTKKL
jgi:hypothetical protein